MFGEFSERFNKWTEKSKVRISRCLIENADILERNKPKYFIENKI